MTLGADMRVKHLAIDGSVVSIDTDADLSTQATATGWAVVPSLRQTHPFTIYPAGHSAVVEKAVKKIARSAKIAVGDKEDYSTKGGQLRIAEVRLPTATGGTRTLTVGGWEGRTGCLATSLVGAQRDRLVEIFDTLQFSERDEGLAIDSPVAARPREPEVVKEVPKVGILSIRPAIPSALVRVPRARGFSTPGGELFRIREASNAVMLVTESAVVSIKPLSDVDTREMMAAVEALRVEWSPRGGG
jgi:hypothetical protein